MRLPSVQPYGVKTQPLPGARVDTGVSPADFGYATGAGLSSLGADVTHVAIYEQAQADDAATAQARAAMDVWDGKNTYTDYANMKGKAAMDRALPLEAEREKYLADVRKGLSPRQQQRFDVEMTGRNAAFQKTLYSRHEDATHEYADESFQNAGVAYLGKVGAAAPGLVKTTPIQSAGGATMVLHTAETDLMLAERLAENDAYIDLNGWRFADPEGMRAQLHNDTMTAHHATIIRAKLAQGDDTTANAYFNQRKKEIDPKVLDTIQADVTKAEEAGTVTRAVAGAWSANFAQPGAFDPPVAGVDAPTVSADQAYGMKLLPGEHEAPLDFQRKQLKNQDGSVSTESTVGIEEDGKFINIPTVIDGKRYSAEDAIKLYKRGDNPAVGVYSTQERADQQAQLRHEALASGKATTRQPTVSERLSSGYADIDKRVKDPALAADAKKQLRANVTASENAANAAREDAVGVLDAEIRGGATWMDITHDPDFRKLTTKQQDGLSTSFTAFRNGENAQTDPESYDTWDTMSVVDQESFMSMDFNTLAAEQRVSQQDKTLFQKRQAEIEKSRSGSGNAETPGFLTASTQVGDLAETFFPLEGVKGTERRLAISTDRATFKRQMESMVSGYETSTKKKAGPDEIDAMAATLMHKYVVTRQRPPGGGGGLNWLGDLFASDTEQAETTVMDAIPPLKLRAIVAGLNDAGVPVTPEAILNEYAAQLGAP